MSDLNPNPQPIPGEGLPGAGNTAVPAGVDDEELFDRIRNWFRASRDHFSEWREEAAECYNFVAGHQWDDTVRDQLAQDNRVPITFNRIAPFVDGVSGLEIGNRQATQYLPRTLGVSGVNELLTGAAAWVRDNCDAEDEESEAVRDNIICGMGVTQTRLDYSIDPDGMICIDRVDPVRELYPDPCSCKANFSDARFVIRIKDMPVDVAEEMYPDEEVVNLHARWAEDSPGMGSPVNARLAPYYREDRADGEDAGKQQVRLVEVEWWEYVVAYRVLDPSTGRYIRVSEQDGIKYRERATLLGMHPQLIRERERKFFRAIVGNVILTQVRGADIGGFSYKFMTGKRDRNKGYWYGVVRAMIDPQMWANKFLSQALHIINTNAKGGLLAETDAFVDIQQAKDEWASADSIIELNPGGIGKIQPKEVPQFPVQINQMMQMAVESIPATAGINLEMIAQQTNDQAGVLEMQRKQQGMTVLAYIFNAKRRYQKEQGRLMLWMIQTFIADGRLIRIGGPENAKYVPLIHDPGMAECDVIVDDAPSSPNMKERVWGMIMQLFPVLRTMALPPAALVEMMRYSPLPASLTEKLAQFASQPPPPPQPKPVAPPAPPTPEEQALTAAQTALTQAQAQKAWADAAMAGLKAKRSQIETQFAPQYEQNELITQEANIENLRAQAINQLQDAQMGPQTAALEVLNHHLGVQDQQHSHAMDQAGHMLQAAQAVHQMNQPPPAPSQP